MLVRDNDDDEMRSSHVVPLRSVLVGVTLVGPSVSTAIKTTSRRQLREERYQEMLNELPCQITVPAVNLKVVLSKSLLDQWRMWPPPPPQWPPSPSLTATTVIMLNGDCKDNSKSRPRNKSIFVKHKSFINRLAYAHIAHMWSRCGRSFHKTGQLLTAANLTFRFLLFISQGNCAIVWLSTVGINWYYVSSALFKENLQCHLDLFFANDKEVKVRTPSFNCMVLIH